MIGIDKIVLNNFTIPNFENLPKRYIETAEEIGESLEEKNDLFDLTFSTRLKNSNELYNIALLSFNPNTILKDTNIENASIEDLERALDRIKRELKNIGIELDTTEAKIRYLEINKNLPVSFRSLEEVMLAIGRANFKNAIGHYSYTEEDIPKLIRQDRGVYINLSGRVIALYDKEFDALRKYHHILGFPLTRVEVRFERDYYREQVKKHGFDNSLEALKNNPKILEALFIQEVKDHVVDVTDRYIQNTIKKNLEKSFISFKENEQRKRKAREEYKRRGKQPPEDFKEIRGVFKYLESESWVFDAEFLREVVYKHVESKSTKRSFATINRDYPDLKNYEKFKKLSYDLAQIFLTH